jgi:hypothetical protein
MGSNQSGSGNKNTHIFLQQLWFGSELKVRGSMLEAASCVEL